MFAAAVPPSPGRRNLDYAFPPFASGLPSVYERAGFDVNPSTARSRSGSRSSSRAGSMRKGSFSSSAVGSNASSFKSQTSLGGALPARDGSPHTPASEFSTFEAELQKPAAPLGDVRRPSSPLVNAATLPERVPAAAPPAAASSSSSSSLPAAAPPVIAVNTYAGGPGPLATPAAPAPPPAAQRAAYNPYNTAYQDAAYKGAPQARRDVFETAPNSAPNSAPTSAPTSAPDSAQTTLQNSPQSGSPAPGSIDGYSADDAYAKSGASASDPQAHSQSASNASTATSEFEFLDPKPALSTMPLNVKPAWAQAQDRVYAAQPVPQPVPQQQATAPPVAQLMSPYAPGAPYVDAPQPYRPQATRVGAGQAGGGLLGVPQHDLNRMSTTSSIYSNRASSMPQLAREAPARDTAVRDSVADSSGSQYDESESSVSFDFADAHAQRPHSVPQADTSLHTQRSGDSQSSGKKRRYCRGCLNPIVGKSVRSRDGTLSGRWHRDCFMCTRCEAPLTGASPDIHVHEDQPFCPGCYHVVAHTTCRMCGKGIEGSCLEATADAGAPAPLLYHVNCLRCTECQIHLQQSYFEVDGATYCAEHAFTSLPQNTEVHKRFTQFMMI